MKKLYITILLLIGVTGFGQSLTAERKLTPNGYFEDVFDQFGNKYNLKDLKAGEDRIINDTLSKSTMICSSGIFDLYFENGSGMENTSNATQNARRAVVCQVFSDLSNFIISPLQGSPTRVKIWVRNITNVPNVPSNALGLATAFYNFPNNATSGFGGIADNEVWKTIISGRDSYTNVSPPLVSSNQTPILSSNFYHGMMAFKFSGVTWNTNLAIDSPAGQYDLYSVVLHEVTHALGFTSLMNANGQSVFGVGYNYFSRYDTFLKNNAGTQPLINNVAACSSMYNYTFNTGLLTSILHPSGACATDQTTCGTAIKFFGTSTVPVYTTNCFEQGSSLSHFEDLCVAPNVNNAYFSMSNATLTGVTKRFLKFQERNTLADIGYKLSSTYGNNSVASGSFNNYNSAITTGISVAGINDGINTNGTFSYIGNINIPITINSATDTSIRILDNDTNAVNFECLQDVFSATSFSSTSGSTTTNITFTSAVAGLHLLRYVPINAAGLKGNITYIYVYLNDTSSCAVATACDFVINGDFEQNSSIPDQLGQVNRACGWSSANTDGSPDYMHRSSPNPNITVPCNNYGTQNDKIPTNNSYMTFVTNIGLDGSPIFCESIRTKLSTPLAPNVSYQLSFDVSLAEGISRFRLRMEAYLSTTFFIAPIHGFIPITNPAGYFSKPTTSNLSNGWERITFIIPARATAGEQYLYLGSLSNTLGTLQNANSDGSCAYNPTYNTNVGQAGFGSSAYYIDNVSLVPVSDAALNLPTSLCINATISNLATYLSAAPAGGVFTGPGITNTGGIYSFNAATAGVGTHTITYTSCNVTVTDTIQVVTSGITPTFDPIAPICPGSTLPTLPTTSNNGISGTWAFVSGTTYNFTPNSNQCAISTSLTITVLPANDPSCATNPCQPNLTLSTLESASVIHKSISWIETNTNYATSVGQDIKSKAGDFIYMKPNTYIKAGSLYFAKIETCTATSKSNIDEPEYFEKEKGETVNIYPNPTNELVTISSERGAIRSITISSIEGKTIYTNGSVNANSFVLNVSNYKNGVFIITIETIDGKTLRQKLIKN